MSKSREDIEKIVSDFDKIAKRDEKKPPVKNVKLMLFVVTILIIAIIVGIYFYMSKNKKSIKVDGKAESSASSGANGPQTGN